MAIDMTVYEDDVATLLTEGSGIATLDTTHRCDRCSSQAWVVMEHPEITGELLFCGHDFSKHSEALAQQGWLTTVDERHKLTNKTQEVHA